MQEKEYKTIKGLSNFWIVLILVLTIMTFIYLFKARHFSEIIKYTLYIAIPIGIIVFLFLIYFWAKGGYRKPKEISLLVSAPFIITFASLSYYALAVLIKDLYNLVQNPSFPKTTAIILTVLITLGIGTFLFYFRFYLRSIYGFTEVVFGLMIAGNKIANQTNLDIFNSSFYLTLLTAAVYLVVRGLDNIHQGLTKEPYDPIAIKISEFLKKP